MEEGESKQVALTPANSDHAAGLCRIPLVCPRSIEFNPPAKPPADRLTFPLISCGFCAQPVRECDAVM